MIVRESGDLLEYLGNTGPITLGELATRTGSQISAVASELRRLIHTGDIVVDGNVDALDRVLRDFEGAEGRESADEFGPQNVRRDFFRALRSQDAQEARLRLSPRAFRRVRQYLGR